MKRWNHGSLFTGIGGFDLAAEWMGWENIFHCEIEKQNREFLKYYWPRAISHADIKTTDFSVYKNKIDVLSGGFPCQPYSSSGLRKGKDDDRHLWPQYLRAIKEIKPKIVVGENVHGIITWNEGMVFDEIQTDLEREGYEVKAFVLPACGVNAPHRRDRTWFIAYANGASTGNTDHGASIEKESNVWWKNKGYVSSSLRKVGVVALPDRYNPAEMFNGFPSQYPLCNGNDGLPEGMDYKQYKWAMKGLGNAIVPQVAFQIFCSIKEATEKWEMIN